MQTQRRFAFRQKEQTVTLTHVHAGQTMCPLLKREGRHSIFLLHLIHLPRFLSCLSFPHTSFLSPAPRMNVALFQIPAPGLHTPICLQMLLFTVYLTVCVCVCVALYAGCVCVSVCVTIHVGDLDCWILNSRKCHVFNVNDLKYMNPWQQTEGQNKTILLCLEGI